MKSKYVMQRCFKTLGEPFYIGTNFTRFLLSGSNYLFDRLWQDMVIEGKNLGNLLVYKTTKTDNPYVYVVDLLLLYPRNVKIKMF